MAILGDELEYAHFQFYLWEGIRRTTTTMRAQLVFQHIPIVWCQDLTNVGSMPISEGRNPAAMRTWWNYTLSSRKISYTPNVFTLVTSLAVQHKCCNLIGYATQYLIVDRHGIAASNTIRPVENWPVFSIYPALCNKCDKLTSVRPCFRIILLTLVSFC